MSGMARRGRPRLVAELARAFVADRLRDLEPQATLDDLARICVEWEDFIREQHNEALREFAGAAYERVVHLEGAREFKTPEHDCNDSECPYHGESDAALIVECRNSLPAVLNLIEAARRMVDQHEDVVHAIEAREALERAVAVFVTPEGDRSTMSGKEEQL